MQAPRHELFISPEVIRELSSPDFKNRIPALNMLKGLIELELTPEVEHLAEALVNDQVMPGPSVGGDALHVAIAIIHRMEFILTWNVKHLANPRKRAHLGIVCMRLGFPVPQLVTPDLLQESDDA